MNCLRDKLILWSKTTSPSSSSPHHIAIINPNICDIFLLIFCKVLIILEKNHEDIGTKDIHRAQENTRKKGDRVKITLLPFFLTPYWLESHFLLNQKIQNFPLDFSSSTCTQHTSVQTGVIPNSLKTCTQHTSVQTGVIP